MIINYIVHMDIVKETFKHFNSPHSAHIESILYLPSLPAMLGGAGGGPDGGEPVTGAW